MMNKPHGEDRIDHMRNILVQMDIVKNAMNY